MKIDVRRILRLSAMPGFGVIVILLATVAAWLLWGRPMLTLAYYRYSSVATARAGLSSNRELVRQAAARGLGSHGKSASGAIPDLIVALTDDSPHVAADAAWAIGSILAAQPGKNGLHQSQATTALLEALTHEDGEVRRYAAYAFSQIKGGPKSRSPAS